MANSAKVTEEGVRLRVSPELTGTVITGLPKGTEVTVPGGTADADGVKWQRVIANKRRGWLAARYLQSPSVSANSIIGLHVCARNSGRLLDHAEQLALAGTPIPVVVVISNPGLAEAIKRVSPETKVVYRWVAGTEDVGPFVNLREDGMGILPSGNDWFDKLWTRHSQAPHADYHQMYNECSFQGNAQRPEYADKVAKFEIELMQAAEQHNVKVLIGNLAPGCLEAKHLTPWYIQMLRYAEAAGHAFNYHAYTDNFNDETFTSNAEWFGMRWEWLLKSAPKLNLIIGEASHYNAPRFRGVMDLTARWNEFYDMLLPHVKAGRDIRVAYWTIGAGGDPLWGGDDFTSELGVYSDWLKNR